jgi:hypothetical protein
MRMPAVQLRLDRMLHKNWKNEATALLARRQNGSEEGPVRAIFTPPGLPNVTCYAGYSSLWLKCPNEIFEIEPYDCCRTWPGPVIEDRIRSIEP